MVVSRLAAVETDVAILRDNLTFRNGTKAKNRLLKAAMTERLSSYVRGDDKKTGIPPQKLINLYDKWAHGGYGIILTGNVVVDPRHLESAGNVTICAEGTTTEKTELLRTWAAYAKRDRTLAVVQLSHAGRQTPAPVYDTPFSASDVQLTAIRRYSGFGKPVPLTVEQIKTEVIDRFTYAAKQCYDAGFSGVQLHGAHGYLLSQFVSPTTNKRIDKYGGSIENRVRIIVEIYESIRKVIPAETGFLVGLKMNSAEFQEGGLNLDDAKVMGEIVEKTGFDFVELSGGTIEKLAFGHLRESTVAREAFFLEFAKEIRPVFKETVVYLTGGFRTAYGMVEAIKDNATDGIGLGRPTAAEPDFGYKILKSYALSAADSKLDQNDFGVTNLAANTQMEQLGRTTVDEVLPNLTERVSDFSDEKTAQRYLEAVKKYGSDLKALVEAGGVVTGVLEFD